MLEHIKQHQAFVVVMSPSCRALGPPSNANVVINSDTWANRYTEDTPHARFCGVALMSQTRHRHYFTCEQPHSTRLWHEPP